MIEPSDEEKKEIKRAKQNVKNRLRVEVNKIGKIENNKKTSYKKTVTESDSEDEDKADSEVEEETKIDERIPKKLKNILKSLDVKNMTEEEIVAVEEEHDVRYDREENVFYVRKTAE